MAEVNYSVPNIQITPVAGMVQQPKTMSLGEMMNLARGAQEYQMGGIALTLEQQKEQERKRAMEFFSRPENFQTNGRIDIDKINAELPKIAPLTGSDYLQKFTVLGNAQTQAIEAKQRLTQDQRSMIGQRFGLLGRLGVQDKEAYIKEMDLLKAENPDNADLARLIDSYKTIWQNIPSGPQLPSMAIAGANTLLKPEQQQQMFAPQPGTISTGAATFPTVTTPSVAGGAPQVTVGQQPLATAQLGPGAREVPTGQVDVNNQPIVNVFDANGRFLGQRAGTGTPGAGELPGAVTPGPRGAPAAPMAPAAPATAPAASGAAVPGGTTPVARLRPGETPQTLQAANDLRTNSMNAAQQVPLQTFNNNQIIKLADDVITGRGANFVGNLTGGYAALPFTSDNATNLNQLGHYMALQTASLANSSGLGGTDAARGIAGEISGTTSWTAPAIKQTARVNRALTTATDLFNQGAQAAFGKSNDPFAVRDFQNKWAQTVDINAVRLFDAMKNNDKEAIREVVTAAGGPNTPGYKRLVDNIGKMQQLIRGQ
jgi:hypothetical protein